MREKLDRLIKLIEGQKQVSYLSKNVSWFVGKTPVKQHYFLSKKYDVNHNPVKRDVAVVFTRWPNLKGIDQDGNPTYYKTFPNDFKNISDSVSDEFSNDKNNIIAEANELAKQYMTGYSAYTHNNCAENLTEAEILQKLKFIYKNIVVLGLDPNDYQTKLIILKLSIIHPIILKSTQLLSQTAGQPIKLITNLTESKNQAEAMLANFNQLSDNGKDYLEKSLEIKDEFHKDGTGEELSHLLKSFDDHTKNL